MSKRVKFSIRQWHVKRVSKWAPIYLSAVLQYLMEEILEAAGHMAIFDKRKRITPRHLFLAIQHDKELKTLFQYTTFASSGALPQPTLRQALLDVKRPHLSLEAREKIREHSTQFTKDFNEFSHNPNVSFDQARLQRLESTILYYRGKSTKKKRFMRLLKLVRSKM